MSRVRICFRYGDHRLASRLICFIRGGDTAHCEVAHRWAADVHDCVSSSFVDGGVRGKKIAMPAAKWRIYEIPGDPERVRGWLARHGGQPYGWLRLLRFLIAPFRWRVGGPVCSQACADAAGWSEPWLYDPRAAEAVCRTLVSMGVAVQIQ